MFFVVVVFRYRTGAANMQGKRNGVANKVKNEVPAAIVVHCFGPVLIFAYRVQEENLIFCVIPLTV